ncbi:MAG: poly-gamma-glutamate biosynthesis protein PgsC [Chlamydiae bacterium]|nr:poly-gamma-glutamate biosynthesis protein PgsC [Chlamydiota bacterium]MBI3277582.1 poly-gamma-glutamate biosynthesis protein PgsC [Chlamydiota bacterium]
MIEQSIGLGLVLSLIFSEIFGLAAGGMVVPGYLALTLHRPEKVIATILISLATYGLVKFLSNFMFIYGRRRTVLTILVSFVFGAISRSFFTWHLDGFHIEIHAIGFVIPGLIAIWMERQGVTATLSTMITVSVLVRLVLMIVSGGKV